MNKNNKIEFGVVVGKSKSASKPYLFTGNITDSIIKAKNFGYSAIEPHIQCPMDINTKNIISQCKKHNIKISGVSTGLSYNIDKLQLIDGSAEKRKLAINRLKEYIDLASIIGGSVIIGTIRGNIPDGSLYKFYVKRLSDSMKILSDYASIKNVALLIEVANRYEVNYLNKVEEVHDFIKSNNIPGVKILMDTFHMNIEESNIVKSIKNFRELLGYFHIADSNRMYPGAGHINFKEIVNALNEINYKGYIVLECLPIPNGKYASKKALLLMKSLFKSTLLTDKIG